MGKLFNFKIFDSKKMKIIILAILGLALGLVYLKFGTKSQSKPTQNEGVQENQPYAEEVSRRVEDIVGSISGVTKAKALVYTKSSIEIVYAEDKDNEGESVSSAVVFEKNGSNTCAVVVKKIYPQIEGILVVVSGRTDEKLRISIINALASVFDINISKVEVLQG